MTKANSATCPSDGGCRDTDPAPGRFGWDEEDASEVRRHAARLAVEAHSVWSINDARIGDITDRLKSAHITLLDIANRLDRLATERSASLAHVGDVGVRS